jgi:hypothetical protein
MKTSNLNKIIIAGLALCGFGAHSKLRADVEVFLVGGSASQSVIYDRATNLFAGGTFTVTGGGSSAMAQFSGTSTNPALSGYGTSRWISTSTTGRLTVSRRWWVRWRTRMIPTIVRATPQVPTFVDSATTPDVVGVNSAGLTALPTYVVPLVFIKNTNSADTAAITNLTQRQAWSLENSTLADDLLWGTSTNQNLFCRTQQ